MIERITLGQKKSSKNGGSMLPAILALGAGAAAVYYFWPKPAVAPVLPPTASTAPVGPRYE